jgi:hypothetical protein
MSADVPVATSINDKPSGATDTEWDYLRNRWDNLRVRTLSNRLYQQERQRIMELREGLVKVASLVFGSVALSRVVKDQAIIDTGIAIIFAGNVSSLVFGWGSKARDAAKRAAEWVTLDRDIEKAGERHFTEDDLKLWYARCSEIESSEPAQNQALFDSCFRRACLLLRVKPPAEVPKYFWRIFYFIP